MSMDELTIKGQTAPEKNQIEQKKNHIDKWKGTIEGKINSSWNGGMFKPAGWMRVMQGTKIENLKIYGQMRMRTPLVTLMDRITTTVKAFDVPLSRTWINAEKYIAQRDSATRNEAGTGVTDAPTKRPQLGVWYEAQAPNTIQAGDAGVYEGDTDCTYWRDSVVGSYLPRVCTGLRNATRDLPNLNNWMGYEFMTIADLVRGYRAIHNDFNRPKETEGELIEFNDDGGTTAEDRGGGTPRIKVVGAARPYKVYTQGHLQRGRRRNNYTTNYRKTRISGEAGDMQLNAIDTLTHAEWQDKASEMLSRAENAEKNPWDIIAEIRGSKVANQGKVKLIGEREIPMNYQQVSQSPKTLKSLLYPKVHGRFSPVTANPTALVICKSAYSLSGCQIQAMSGQALRILRFILTIIKPT